MKSKILACIAVASVLFANTTSFAQTTTSTQTTNTTQTTAPKFGYLNSLEILYLMPEMKKVEEDLMVHQGKLEAEMGVLAKQYEDLVKKYQQEEATLSAAIKKIKVEEIQQKEEQISKTEEAFQLDLQEKQQILLDPLIKKVEQAIKDIASEKGLSYVFDTSKGALLFVTESDDISKEVRAKLSIPEDAKLPMVSGSN